MSMFVVILVELTNGVSEAKIQITLLKVRRGAPLQLPSNDEYNEQAYIICREFGKG